MMSRGIIMEIYEATHWHPNRAIRCLLNSRSERKTSLCFFFFSVVVNYKGSVDISVKLYEAAT